MWDDVIDPDNKAISPAMFRTDGLYVWREDIAYYVERYRLKLPEALLRRMRRLKWAPPPVPRPRLLELESQWRNCRAAGLGR